MNKSIEISIQKLKNLLGLEDSYDRFFDFEKMILKPAFQEISKVTKKILNIQKLRIEIPLTQKLLDCFLK